MAVALPSVGQPGHFVEKTAERMELAKKKGIDEVQRHVAAAPGLRALQARRDRGIKTPTRVQG